MIRPFQFFLVAVLAIGPLCSGRALAQEAILPPTKRPEETLPPPEPPVVTPEQEQILRSTPAPAPTVPPPTISTTESTVPGATTDTRPVSDIPRRFHYNLSLTVRGVYDDNINISSFDRISDYYFAIEPLISLALGGTEDVQGANTLSLIYRPSFYFFVDHSENDSIQHVIQVAGSHEFGHLSLSVSQNIQILDGVNLNSLSDTTGHNANVDVGRPSRHNIFTTNVNDSYDLTGKLFLSNGLSFAVDDYPGGSELSSKNFSGNLFLNYRYSDKLTVGLGGTGGYNTVEGPSTDQTYEQANARLDYQATGKINLAASFGAEFRQFENSRGLYVSPVYSLSASYQPFDGTSIGISGSRRTENSASLVGQDFASTDISVSISQRFISRFDLGLYVGYENLNYFSTIQGVSANREDNFYYVEPSIDFKITRYWKAGVYYLYRQDLSSFDFFSFYDNQVGVRSTLTF